MLINLACSFGHHVWIAWGCIVVDDIGKWYSIHPKISIEKRDTAFFKRLPLRSSLKLRWCLHTFCLFIFVSLRHKATVGLHSGFRELPRSYRLAKAEPPVYPIAEDCKFLLGHEWNDNYWGSLSSSDDFHELQRLSSSFRSDYLWSSLDFVEWPLSHQLQIQFASRPL
jgi:hypothetical protein